MQLHPITHSNAHTIQPLMAQVYPATYAHLWKDNCQWYLNTMYNISQIEQELNDPTEDYWTIQWENSAVGIYKISERSCPDHPTLSALKLNRIYLHPKAQGLGFGKQLMQLTESIAKERKKELIWLEAMDTQARAIQFYEHFGYRICGHFSLDFPYMHDEMRGMVRMSKLSDTAGNN